MTFDIHSISQQELSATVDAYPYFAQAHKEMCRRACVQGGWNPEEVAAVTLYLGDRKVMSELILELRNRKAATPGEATAKGEKSANSTDASMLIDIPDQFCTETLARIFSEQGYETQAEYVRERIKILKSPRP